jgi:hypothetical protein
MPVEQREGVESVGIGNPAGTARGYASETPANVVAASQLRFLGDEEPEQRAANAAETDDGEVVERDGSLVLGRLFSDRAVEFLRDGGNVRGFGFEYARGDYDLRVHIFPLFLFDGLAHGGKRLRFVAGVLAGRVNEMFEPRATGKALLQRELLLAGHQRGVYFR